MGRAQEDGGNGKWEEMILRLNLNKESASWRANQIPASIYFHLATRQNSTNRKIVYSKACKTFHNMSFC